jgi:hypothetical protein
MANENQGGNQPTPNQQQGSNVDTQTIRNGGDPTSTSGQTSDGSNNLSFDRSGNAGSAQPTPKQGVQTPQQSPQTPGQSQNGSNIGSSQR